MEMSFLLFLQELHNPVLDFFFMNLTHLGDAGVLWIIAGVILLCIKKYRKQGFLLLFSLLCCLLIGNIFLKNVIARERPCWVNTDILLLIPNPKDFSFPSGHSMVGFAGALSVWYADKKWGVAALVLAGTIAFSRLYLFVHYPSDVVIGSVIGLLVAFLIHKAAEKMAERKGEHDSIEESK